VQSTRRTSILLVGGGRLTPASGILFLVVARRFQHSQQHLQIYLRRVAQTPYYQHFWSLCRSWQMILSPYIPSKRTQCGRQIRACMEWTSRASIDSRMLPWIGAQDCPRIEQFLRECRWYTSAISKDLICVQLRVLRIEIKKFLVILKDRYPLRPLKTTLLNYINFLVIAIIRWRVHGMIRCNGKSISGSACPIRQISSQTSLEEYSQLVTYPNALMCWSVACIFGTGDLADLL
jgi:hypothetical protein